MGFCARELLPKEKTYIQGQWQWQEPRRGACSLHFARLQTVFFFFLAAVDGDGEAIYVPVVAMMTERRTTHRNATQRNASIGIGRHRAGHRSWHTAFGRLLSRTLLFYILGSTHRPPPASEQKK